MGGLPLRKGLPGEPSVLSWGIEPLDAWLPGGGLLRGAVVELAVRGATALATSLALRACRAAQAQGPVWCGFVDPSGSLHAPGVASHGVSLERLLVVRPLLEDLGRVALRLVEARALSVVVVDTLGTPERPLDVHLGPWVRGVRRLSQTLQGTESTVLLLTDQDAPRPLALPVAQRIELSRKSEREISLAVTRDPRGRLLPPHTLAIRDLFSGQREEGPGLSSPRPRRMAGAA